MKKLALWIGIGAVGIGSLWALQGGGNVAPLALAEEKGAGGAICGKVTWDGPVPEPKKLEVNKDNEKCECMPSGAKDKFKLDESLVVDSASKGVAHCVVYLKGATGGPTLGPATIDQKGCQFVPHVALVSKGQKVKVLNPDKIDHNFHVWGKKSGNLTIQKFKQAMEVSADYFAEAEFIHTTCDIHAWMSGWIAVVDNGYAAVTNEKGEYKIEGIPPGKYTVALWHEPLSKEGQAVMQEKGEVVVEAGKAADAGFTLK